MSLRDLKNLAPWQWESKVAQKKHAIGPKGMRDFEQVARVLQGDGGVDVAENQVANLKRRRCPKEYEDASAVASKQADHRATGTADAGLAAGTPAVPVKKQRPSAVTSTPAPLHTSTASFNGGRSHQKPPSCGSSGSRGKQLASPAGVPTPGFGLSLYSVAVSPGPVGRLGSKGAMVMRPGAVMTAVADSCNAGQAELGAVEHTQQDMGEEWRRRRQQQLNPALRAQPTVESGRHTPAAAAAAVPPAAAAAAATPTASSLLAHVFSPSPCVPTPTPYATLRFRCAATPAAAEEGIALKAVGFCGISSAFKPQVNGGSSSGGGGVRRPAAAAGTPLPRPQFTTPRMLPPANKRNTVQQQTPLGALAAGSGRSSSMKRSPPAAETPPGTTGTGVEPMPALQSLLSDAGGMTSPRDCNPAAVLGDAQNPPLNPTSSHGPVKPGHRFSLMSPGGLTAGSEGSSGVARDSHSPPGVLQASGPAAAAAGADEQGRVVGSSSVLRCSSTARLPAKLRCKQEGSTNRSAAMLGQLWVAVGSPDSSREASPAAAASASPCVPSLTDLADAAAAEGDDRLQQQNAEAKNWHGGSSSATRFTTDKPRTQGPAAAAAASHMPAGSSSKASTVTPAGRMGLKRLWCHTHAAAMAAEAAAAVQHRSSHNAVAVPGGTTPQAAAVRPDVRSWSPDSQAVVVSAELLLAAAELEGSAAAVQAVQVEVPITAGTGQQPAAAGAGAADKDANGDAQQQQQQHLDNCKTGHIHATATAAASDVLKDNKPHYCSQHHMAAESQQQMDSRYSKHSGAAAAAANNADVAADASPPGDSLMLPPAAQLRLLQQDQQQQPAAAVQIANPAAAVVRQPTWAVAIPTTTGTVVASAAQLTSAVQAATSTGLQSMPYMLFGQAPLAATAAAGHQRGTEPQQQHLPALPVGLQQLNVQQLNQQLAAMGYNSNGGSNRSSSAAADASVGGRMTHVSPALHAAQAGLTRTSHTGVLLQSALPGGPASQAAQQRQHHAAAAAWDQAIVLGWRQQQQQQARAAAVSNKQCTFAAGVRGCTFEPFIMRSVDAAAAQVHQQQQVPMVDVELPSIEPLHVPATLSDDEAWHLALANPQVIKSEAARARQLLAGVSRAAAAPGPAAALAVSQTMVEKQPTGNIMRATAVQNCAMAGSAAAPATSCQGIHYRHSSIGNSIPKGGKQQLQSPSKGHGFGVLRTANLINTR